MEVLAASATLSTRTMGEDPNDFWRDQRIHIQHGSLFVDPYLVLHPRELDPKNEARLRKKLELTYTINNPSFFESPERTAVALHLAQLIPVSLESKRSRLMEEVKKFNAALDQPYDSELAAALLDKLRPFAGIVREASKQPDSDPVGMEMLKNGIATYLLMREKLTQNKYLSVLTDYTPRLQSADQVLTDLGDKIGVSPIAVRAAALKNGVDGVGELLGLDPRYVADVKRLAEHIATRDFGYNMVEHWHIGRQLMGLDTPFEEKMRSGLQARIDSKIEEFRRLVKQQFDVPAPIQAEEKRIADALMLVSPIQRKLLYALGYEICYTPEATADAIAFYPGIYGLHRKAANNLNDLRGTYRIYFSGKGDLEGSMRTLVHEVAHNLWPNYFSPEQVADIDALANLDAQRFARLNSLLQDNFKEFEGLLNAYHAASEAEKPEALERARPLFERHGFDAKALFPYVKDAHEFEYMVKHAISTLNVEGERYSRSGYDSPQERFREVISRFAELKQVRHRSQPELLTFLAPGLTKLFDEYYLPHLERVYADVTRTLPQQVSVAQAMAELPQSVPKKIDQPVVEPPSAVSPVPAQPKIEQRPGVAAVSSSCADPLAIKARSVQASPNAFSLSALLGANPKFAPAMQALGALSPQHSL